MLIFNDKYEFDTTNIQVRRFYMKGPGTNSADKTTIFNADKLFDKYDSNLAKQLISKALETLPEYYDQLQNIYKQKDYKRLRQVAHTIKGMAMNIYTEALRESAAKLEKAAGEKDQKKTKTEMEKIENVYSKTLKKLEEHVTN